MSAVRAPPELEPELDAEFLRSIADVDTVQTKQNLAVADVIRGQLLRVRQRSLTSAWQCWVTQTRRQVARKAAERAEQELVYDPDANLKEARHAPAHLSASLACPSLRPSRPACCTAVAL